MTLVGLVARNALRNKRRAVPTILSIGFSILLLTIMMALWRTFYIDQLSPASTIRLFTRSPHVFFTYAMPTDYRQDQVDSGCAGGRSLEPFQRRLQGQQG
jgi:hypothetical protein